MIQSFIELTLMVAINLIAVKLIFLRNTEDKQKPSVSWKDSLDSLTAMEERLHRLQQRDMEQQQQIWALEDEKRDLQNRITKLTKDLLLATKRHDDLRMDYEEDDDEPA